MTKLNEQQKKLLKSIVDDKFSIGAFSGMVYNSSLQHPDKDVTFLVQKALDVRLLLLELSK